ncbi:MAG: 4-(cytidine 5'-diphospho)-2-C-methyl-D-erythritol kinase [Verrucomicrobiota bacterium]|jgi:4-diphosphocytidyl-2-C-methyl-D-erythritol kinase
MALEKKSPCKVNLLLNVLGKRPDGFHELETVLHPVKLFDEIHFERGGNGIQLTCDESALPVDSKNLVYRAAEAFLKLHNPRTGVRIHLQKKIPLAAGLGGGSGNAATTLLGLNELFGSPLSPATLANVAAVLGSDVPFFLQSKPALATGRGENIRPLDFFPALRGKTFLLIHPGFGIATTWAYQSLARFPAALNGRRGRAEKLVSLLQAGDWRAASAEFYNALEAPAFEKFPVLKLYQEFLCANGAQAVLMSGSGSTTSAIAENVTAAESLVEKFKSKFGTSCWTAVVKI